MFEQEVMLCDICTLQGHFGEGQLPRLRYTETGRRRLPSIRGLAPDAGEEVQVQQTSRRTIAHSENATSAAGLLFADVQETGGWQAGSPPLHIGLLLSTCLVFACYAGAQNVSLQWDANPEPNIDHYVVYCRPLAGGPFSRVNDFPIAHMGAPSTISFTDTSNAAACGGLPAEYVITAIDAEGEESGFSNAVPIATTTLPAPIVVDCTEANLIAGIAQANGSGGGTITFNCQNQTIFLGQGLGSFQGNVVLDGENPNIILEYSGPFAGCVTGKNEIGGPAIVQLTGGNNVVRNLTFRNFLESLQISGPGNTIENNNFMAHLCSDDGLSTIDVAAVGTLVQGNLFEDYKDKAFQMSFGGGTVTANTFVDSKQPIRAPFDNSAGDTFILTDNVITTTPGNTSACDGVRIDGTYHIVFEGNTHSFCKRGVRLGGDIEAEIRDNVINDNQQAGIRLGGNARASLSGNTIQDNGSVPGSLPEGGVVVWENAEVDLGGGSLMIGGQLLSSVGQNTLTGNNVVDARNLRVGFTLTAENNCWDNSTVADVLAQDVEGTVDVNPIACSSTTTTTTTTTTTSSTTSTTVTTTTTSSTTSTIVTTTTTTHVLNNDDFIAGKRRLEVDFFNRSIRRLLCPTWSRRYGLFWFRRFLSICRQLGRYAQVGFCDSRPCGLFTCQWRRRHHLCGLQ